MSGRIYCNRCGADFSKQTAGVCPKCSNPTCFISVYWKRPGAAGSEKAERYKFYSDMLRDGVPLYYLTALDQLAAITRDIKAGRFDPADWQAVVQEHKIKYLASEWIGQREKDVAKGELKNGTLHAYRSHIKVHIIPRLGEIGIAALGYDELVAFKNSLPGQLSKKTQREILHTLHNFLVWCETEKRLIQAVPRIPLIKGKDAKPKQALAVLQKIEALRRIPERHRDFFEFEMRTGVRPGESCALKVKDVLPDLQAIRIQRSFSDRMLTESDKEDHKMLLALTTRTLELVLKHSTGKTANDFLFINPDTGRHYTVHNTDQYWKRWSGASVTHYEATRHSAGTAIAEMFDVRAVQRVLRQSNLSSAEPYMHEAVENLRKILEQYDQTMPADGLRTAGSEDKAE